MCGYSFYEMFFIFLFWGMIGWLIEVVDMRIEAGEFQNRGFLHVPLCPLYGIGMLVMCMLFKNQNKGYVELFISGMIIGSMAEYFAGWLLERLFHARWWDYSHMRFQVGGRVCMRNTILFGFGAIFTLAFVQPVLEKRIHQIPVPVGLTVIAFAEVILVIDIATSVLRAMRYGKVHNCGNVYIIFKSHR